jgi:hypothetical protein
VKDRALLLLGELDATDQGVLQAAGLQVGGDIGLVGDDLVALVLAGGREREIVQPDGLLAEGVTRLLAAEAMKEVRK